jgi:sortase A
MRIGRAWLPLAWTLLACVLVTAVWAGFTLADPLAGRRQQALQHSLHQQWQTAPAAHRAQPHPDRIRLVTGRPFALMRVPAFGRKWQFAIVEGTSLRQLALGPGHVRGTGLPGRPGNFVVAAHDVTAGNSFLHLRQLRHPDKVYVRTQHWLYEYVVRSERIVRYTNIGVEYPVPGHPGQAPHRSLITLITCTPVTLAFTPWRIVVTGELVRSVPRGEGAGIRA